MTVINVVILAAGQGTRMNSSLPKVLQPLAGQPILKHILTAARTLSPERICVVYGYGGELVQSRIEDTDIVWVQQKQQLGTAHAVQQVLSELPESGEVLVLLGDTPLIRGQTLQRLEEAAKGQILTVLTAEVDEPAGYGRIVRDEQGRVVRVVEEKDATPAERNIREVNTGVLVCSIEKLRQWLPKISNDNAKSEYYLTDIVAMAQAEDLVVETVQPAAPWETLGVNDKMQLAALERILQRNQAQTLLAAGVTLADPARIDIRGDLSCGNDVYIDINCIFEGWVELENNVHIGPGCVLRNVRIDSGTQVSAYSCLEGCETGTNCIIGPYARIRGQTTLGCGVHIGNFVEIKNSELDDNAKANHLSYLGDAVIGKRVNIGAGAITCNYDGVNKFQTVIEDDVFIGSDTQLVAPVRVGQGATLGAGTTLTHDAPAEQLTLSRAEQQTLADWKRPGKKEVPRGK